MMKYIKLIIILPLLQCSMPEDRNEKDKVKELSFQELSFYEIRKDNGVALDSTASTKIIFEGSFQNDSVKLFVDSKIIFNKLISTDHTIGIAYSDTFNFLTAKNVKIKFKDYPPKTLDSIKFYSYLYISKRINSKTINLQFSNEGKKYK